MPKGTEVTLSMSEQDYSVLEKAARQQLGMPLSNAATRRPRDTFYLIIGFLQRMIQLPKREGEISSNKQSLISFPHDGNALHLAGRKMLEDISLGADKSDITIIIGVRKAMTNGEWLLRLGRRHREREVLRLRLTPQDIT